MDVRTCSRCGEAKPKPEWYPSKWGQSGQWCKECYRSWHRERYEPKNGVDDAPRDCAWCGASFRPKQRRAVTYCSRACKEDAREAKRVADRLASKSTNRECLHCAKALPQTMRSDAVFCSEKCNHAAHKLIRALRRRGGTSGEIGYLRAAICKRDGWRCGICGERVPPSLNYPHPRSASMDHILPVCEGGTSDPANLRLTHLNCNVRRRHLGGFEQLALI